MIKGISKDIHWIADYSYVPFVMAAPHIAGFPKQKVAADLCCVFSTTVLVYSLLTDAKWGVVKIIPYKTHAALDISMGVAAFAVPLIIKKVCANQKARNTFLLMGIVGLAVGVLSLIGDKKQ